MGGELAESLQTDFLALDKDFSDLEQEYYSQPVTSKQNLCSDEVNLARRCASQPTYPASDDEMLDDPSYTSTSRAATSDRLEVARIEGHDTSVAYIRGFEIGSKVTNDGGDEPPWTFEDFDLQRLLELTDAALRTLICAKPIRTTGIKVLGASSGPKLADISPALFSPDYLPVRHTTTPETHCACSDLRLTYWS